MHEVALNPGRERSLRRRHPWLLSGAVAREPGSDASGELLAVRSAGGEVLGHGLYSAQSQIRVRMVSFGKEEPPGSWLTDRVVASAERRVADPLLGDTDAVRLVNSEGDGLPGLVVDRYADTAVVRLSCAGMVARREELAEALRGAGRVTRVFERRDAAAARREGFEVHDGALLGSEPEGEITIRERGRIYGVDVRGGQKTGFYLDQRDSRDLVGRLAAGRTMLDLFSYTGGFACAAARGGAAALTLVDSSAEALDRARRNLARNGAAAGARLERADAFEWVRATGDRFELIVVDPPPLARRRGDVPKASRAYKDIVLHALRHLAPGGYLLAFRCSQPVGSELFRKIVFGASLDAGRPVQVLAQLGLPVDHPVALDHPEGDYLSGLLLRAV